MKARSGAQLDGLVEEFIALRGRRGSDWSTAALSENGAPDLSPARFAARIQPQRDLLAQLQAVVPEGLTLPEETDRQVMLALLESDIYDAERRRTWENQPLLYVPVRQISGLFEAVAIRTWFKAFWRVTGTHFRTLAHAASCAGWCGGKDTFPNAKTP